MNVYEKCPILENDKYCIRLIDEKDASDLFDVYHDKLALPFFNSDNCHGSNFYCENIDDVRNTIKYWLIEYFENHSFVRFSILDKLLSKVIGTIEIFKREANDFFHQCGLLRIDLGSSFEDEAVIYDILWMIIPSFYHWFSCPFIATKAPIYAIERIKALKKIGFKKSDEILYGHNKEIYYDYWIIKQND